MHIELLSFAAIQPNTGGAGVVLVGDSATAKNGRGKIQIIAAWSRNQVAGFSQIAFPSGHDVTRGIRVGAPVGANLGIVPLGVPITVQAQELMTVTLAGSNVAGDVEQLSMLLRYDDLPGIAQRLISPAQLENRVEKFATIEISNASTAGPSYGTPTTITTPADLLLANREYAVIGATTRSPCQSVYFVGPDTGNLRIGVPGDSTKPELTSQWFSMLSRVTGSPCIPVISSGNKSSTFAHATADENAGTFLTTWFLALLK